MRIETGTIVEIRDCSENGKTNKAVMIQLNDNESIPVQFQGRNRKRFKEGQQQNISVIFFNKYFF